MAAGPRVHGRKPARFLGETGLSRRGRPVFGAEVLVAGSPPGRRPGAAVTLTTDFGDGSPYAAALRGAILARCPKALVVDVSHSVPPFDLGGGAFVLWAGTSTFPAGSVHLAVVDPGVGTARRALALAAGGSFFVAPDNGVLELVLRACEAGPGWQAVELPRPAGASPTFEGRDVFAPAAASLACGAELIALGPPVGDPVRMGPLDVVLWVDRFGNLVTGLAGPAGPLQVGGSQVRQVATTYGSAPAGQPFVYLGSMGLLEVAVPNARADLELGAAAGTPVARLDG